jgi:hypothetical protein
VRLAGSNKGSGLASILGPNQNACCKKPLRYVKSKRARLFQKRSGRTEGSGQDTHCMGLYWPRRWILSCACCSTAGFHLGKGVPDSGRELRGASEQSWNCETRLPKDSPSKEDAQKHQRQVTNEGFLGLRQQTSGTCWTDEQNQRRSTFKTLACNF